MGVKALAVISARGGSKGIPRKNIRELAGRPLIAWTIQAALESTSLDRVIVSTDDSEIAEISRVHGADVPFMRPAELALDETAGIAPVLHALDELPGYDVVVLLQPTSPLRTSADIDGVVELLEARQSVAAVSVTPVQHHPHLMFSRDDADRLVPLIPDRDPDASRRQDLPSYVALNGAVYAARTQWLQASKDFLSTQTRGYVMPPERSVDVDTELDWRWVEFLIKERGVE